MVEQLEYLVIEVTARYVLGWHRGASQLGLALGAATASLLALLSASLSSSSLFSISLVLHP